MCRAKRGKISPSKDQYQSHPRSKNRGKETARTYVERTETRAVRIKGLIVESGELLSDSVDVCHGLFQVGGGERVSSLCTDAWHRWLAAASD
jgi:hypothetical protein